MIEPVTSGAALMEQVAATRTGEDRVALWWLGQSGYLLRWQDLTVLIDPYLSDHLSAKYAGTDKPHDRLTRSPLQPEEVTQCDLVLVTHRHSDHLDPGTLPTLLRNCPEALVVLPAALADYAADQVGVPDERLVPIRDGEFFELEGLRVFAMPAAHEALDTDPQGNHLYLSYAIVCHGVTLFAAGDTVPWRGQEERLATYNPQVVLLPINGRSARLQELGTPGNLTIAEAARLAAAAGAEVVVPNHYDMFAFNTAEVAEFVAHVEQHYPRLKVQVLKPGERWVYP